MNNYPRFSWKRLGFLMRNDIVVNVKIIGITAGAIAAIFLLYHLVLRNSTMVNTPPSGYLWILWVGGLWVTSLAFQEVYNPQQSYYFLTVPCSRLEKLLSRLLLTSVGYAGVTLILYLLFCWSLSVAVTFKPLPEIIAAYLVAQSILFFGSIYFKSHVFIKTIASVAVFLIILASYLFILGMFLPHNPYVLYKIIPALQTVSHVVLYYFVPIYFWVLSYIRFTEFEVI